MRQLKILFFIVLFLTFSTISYGLDSTFKNVPVHTCFSPKGTCEKDLVNVFNLAKTEIRVYDYSFTSKSIANALCEAKKKGVDVKVVLDKSQPTAKGKQIDIIKTCGIDVKIDSQHAIMHNKVSIIDKTIVSVGSFNYTYSAQNNNAENYNFIGTQAKPAPKDWVQGYLDNWLLHYSHSDTY